MTCAYAVRVALMKFAGVESVDVSLNKGLATVKLKPGNVAWPGEFWEAIRRNGNTPKTTRVVVRGEVLASGKRLKIGGVGEALELKGSPAVIQQLTAAAGKTLTLEGTLTPGKDAKTVVPLEVQAVGQ